MSEENPNSNPNSMNPDLNSSRNNMVMDDDRLGNLIDTMTRVFQHTNQTPIANADVAGQGVLLGNNGEESVFDCKICLDLAKDPIVTSCGHLFCWSCICRWSEVKGCPVCKGKVNFDNVTPIYGRGDNIHCVPPRPPARRVRSLQEVARSEVGPTSMERLIARRFGDQDETMLEVGSGLLLSRVLTSRGLRRETTDLMSKDLLHDERLAEPQASGLGLAIDEWDSVSEFEATNRTQTSDLTRMDTQNDEPCFHRDPVEWGRNLGSAINDWDSMCEFDAPLYPVNELVDNVGELSLAPLYLENELVENVDEFSF